MAYSLSSVPQLFKTLFPDGIESSVLGESPLLGLIQKNTRAYKGFTGSGRELPWKVSRGGGASADFATAQAAASEGTYRKPVITRGRLYVVKKLDHEALEASEGNAGAFVSMLKEATDEAIEDLRIRAGSVILGDGTGSIGRISTGATVGSATVALEDPTQIVNFRIGQKLQAFAPGAGATRSAGAVATLTAVNEDLGTITVATAWTTSIAAVVAGDMLVPLGDFNAVPKGLFAWNPSTLPSSGDSFFGVDRSTHGVAMCGARIAPSTGNILEVIKDGMARHARQGGDHDTLLLNPDDWASLEKESNNWQRITKNAVSSSGKEIASIGFNGLVMNSPKGSVAVYSDPYLKRYSGKLMKLSSLEIWSLNDPFRLLPLGANSDGMVRDASADASELRYGGYWNMVVKKPRDVCDITFPTA